MYEHESEKACEPCKGDARSKGNHSGLATLVDALRYARRDAEGRDGYDR